MLQYFMLILLCNGQNKAEYEAYWLLGVPIIRHAAIVNCANQPTKIIMFLRKLTNKYKENYRL